MPFVPNVTTPGKLFNEHGKYRSMIGGRERECAMTTFQSEMSSESDWQKEKCGDQWDFRSLFKSISTQTS